jgi:putative ABC transport system permease protein
LAARLVFLAVQAVALVFLIACGNAAGFLLARGLRRQQEYALRCALGAQRVQLFRQVLVESMLLALSGGALGAMLSIVIVAVLKAFGGFAIPRLDAVTIGWPVLAFCFMSAVIAAVLAGLLPALRPTAGSVVRVNTSAPVVARQGGAGSWSPCHNKHDLSHHFSPAAI